ncbi:helix-turn-helix transcriptional regulator [Actinokineospora sp. PR83]|uniref:helix-turn-helix domain-containing protein n=1 Tax=Actinokineospora sp. PR83 TaxID=2884908 RepID=UPI0027E03766|nr:helix-turn-helix transcriptional regulator [Actinokineospora sp. PR83]MCG8918873.1 helix-turn-helix transcriptional regulator [Actinokineospora sp. PR83]
MGYDTVGQLGRYLRTLRESEGLTQTQLADRLNCKQSKINKLEVGETRVNPEDLSRAVDLLQAHGPQADRMIALAKELDATHHRRPRLADEKSNHFRRLRGEEQEADEILAVTGDRFPGLLHAEAYMRDLFATDGLGDVDARVAARAERAGLYDRTPAPHHRVLLGEGALVRLVRSKPAPVAAAQLRHLVHLVDRHPGLHLRVLAFDADIPVLPNDFTVLCFRDGRPNLGYQETPVDARIITKKADVAALIREWHEVADKALSEADTRELLTAELARLP